MTQSENKHQVVWFDIPTRDLDRAIRFYSAVLACKIERQDFGPEWSMAVLPHEGESVGGCLVGPSAEYEPGDKGILVYLNCHGRLDDAIAQVAPNGGAVLMEKHQIGPYGSRAIVRDSEGNRLALHSM